MGAHNETAELACLCGFAGASVAASAWCRFLRATDGPRILAAMEIKPMPRLALFRDPAAEVVMAAILALDTGLQTAVLSELQNRLAVDAFNSPNKRAARGKQALHEAARILGRSPSIPAYRKLRREHPEFRWPSDGAIRKHSGGTWNQALEEAYLDPVADGDAFVCRQLGPSFLPEEVEDALRACAADISRVPLLSEYLHWAQRDEVQSRPDRVPLSLSPFERLYGGFQPALIAAGLREPDEVVEVASGVVRSAKLITADEEILDALREVAARMGGSPYTAEYMAARKAIIAESRMQGRLRTIPAKGTIVRRFGSFDKALIAAGLEPTNGRSNPRRKPGPKKPTGPRVPNERMIACILEAYDELGEPFTRAAYTARRKRRFQQGQINRGRTALPSDVSISNRFGGWAEALEAAFPLEADPKAFLVESTAASKASSSVSASSGRPASAPRERELSPALDPTSLLRLSDDEFAAPLRLAFSELGEPFTGPGYARWRRQRLEEDPDLFLPSLYLLKKRFGSYTEACHVALPWLGRHKRRLAGPKVVEARSAYLAALKGHGAERTKASSS
jgi:hypothetical protein